MTGAFLRWEPFRWCCAGFLGFASPGRFIQVDAQGRWRWTV